MSNDTKDTVNEKMIVMLYYLLAKKAFILKRQEKVNTIKSRKPLPNR